MIIESKDLNITLYDKIIGSLLTYEIDVAKNNYLAKNRKIKFLLNAPNFQMREMRLHCCLKG